MHTDTSSDCEGLLRCFQRSESSNQPPLSEGCCDGPTNGTALYSSWDYCYDPAEYRGPEEHQVCGSEMENLGYNGVPLLGCCQGDCDDTDSDCAIELICYDRTALEDPGPLGCNGDPYGLLLVDYCYDPNYSPSKSPAPRQGNGGGVKFFYPPPHAH